MNKTQRNNLTYYNAPSSETFKLPLISYLRIRIADHYSVMFDQDQEITYSDSDFSWFSKYLHANAGVVS
jgi:hypothetical protein